MEKDLQYNYKITEDSSGGIAEQFLKTKTEESEKIIKNLKLEKNTLENEMIQINKKITEIDTQLYNYNRIFCSSSSSSNNSFSNSILNTIKNNIVHNQ